MDEHQRTYLRTVLVAIGWIFLVFIVLAGWLPRPCTLAMRTLAGCVGTLQAPPLTMEQMELNRFPHQTITAQTAIFESTIKEGTDDLEISARYALKNPLNQVLVLNLKTLQNPSGEPIALISHPLMKNLAWSGTIRSQVLALHQQNSTYSSFEALQNNPPPAATFAADAAAAAQLNLAQNSYTPLEPLTDLKGITTIVTTYHAGIPDGRWQNWSYRTSAANLKITDGKVFGYLTTTPISSDEPLYFNSVNLNQISTEQRL